MNHPPAPRLFWLASLLFALHTAASFWAGTGWLVQAAPPTQAQLALFQDDPCDTGSEWQELASPEGVFLVVFPASETQLAEDITIRHAAALEESYQQFAALFQTNLQLPLMLRIYPTPASFNCINVLKTNVIPDYAFHSRVGQREISLFSSRLTEEMVEAAEGERAAWLINGIRHELGALFVRQISEGLAPPGLEAGMGGYAENPQETFTRWYRLSLNAETPGASWRQYWEDPALARTGHYPAGSTSIVAYLVDVYGWPRFLVFIQSLRTGSHYRQTLEETYKTDSASLQTQWQAYYPLYVEGRWRAHTLYEFDLSGFEQMLANQSYSDAARGLQTAIAHLETLAPGSAQARASLARAQELLEQAQAGGLGFNLARQAYQAAQSGEYERVLQLAVETRRTAALAIPGNPPEALFLIGLDVLEAHAREMLALRAEVAVIGQNTPEEGIAGALVIQTQIDRLLEIGTQQGELGDSAGREATQAALQHLKSLQTAQARSTTSLVLTGCLLLVLVRIVLVLRKPRPEVLDIGYSAGPLETRQAGGRQ